MIFGELVTKTPGPGAETQTGYCITDEVLLYASRQPRATQHAVIEVEPVAPPTEEHRAAWNRMIDGRLVEWGRHPEALADDDFTPPEADAISLAYSLAQVLRDAGAAPPLRVVTDGEGGVSFEWKAGEFFLSLGVHPDGQVETLIFRDCKLVERQRFLVPLARPE